MALITTVEQAKAAGEAARLAAQKAGLDPISGQPLTPPAVVDESKAAAGAIPGLSKEASDALMARLLGTDDISSSEISPADKLISEAIGGLEAAKGTTEAGIKAKYERERMALTRGGGIAETTLAEARGGFATNMMLFKKLYEDVDTQMKDLDLREQEALAIGQYEVASNIANLKLQQLTFRQQASDSLWNKVIQGIQVGLQQKQFTLQEKEAKFTRATNMLNLMQTYGLMDKFSVSQMADIEKEIGLKEGTLKTIIPKKNEDLQFYTTDNYGNVTAIYQDKNTGVQRTQIYKGIGQTKVTEGKPIITQSTLNSLANAGVPNAVATGIQEDLNNGFSIDAIKVNLKKMFGDTGDSYLKLFTDEMKKIKSFQINI